MRPLTASPAVAEHLTIEDAWQFEQACQRLDLAFCQCTKADDKAQLMQTIKHSVGVKLMVRNLTEALIRASRSAMRFSDKIEDVALYCALLLKVTPGQLAGCICTDNCRQRSQASSQWHCAAHSKLTGAGATEADLHVCTQGGEFCRCQQVLSLIDQLDDDEKMLEEIRSIFKVRHPNGLPALPQC